MDEELKEEFKKINREIKGLNINIDELKKKVGQNFFDAKRTTLVTIGLSLVLASIYLLQQHDWISSGFFIFLGIFLAVFASHWGKTDFSKFARIAKWLAIGIAIGFTIYVVVVVRSA